MDSEHTEWEPTKSNYIQLYPTVINTKECKIRYWEWNVYLKQILSGDVKLTK